MDSRFLDVLIPFICALGCLIVAYLIAGRNYKK
jgi:hypothetical protein